MTSTIVHSNKIKILKKHIGLISNNYFKLTEVSEYFEFYDYIVDKVEFNDIIKYLNSSIKGERLVKGVIKEQTKIYSEKEFNDNLKELKIDSCLGLTRCVCESTLLYYSINKSSGELDVEIYKKQIRGYLNFSKRNQDKNLKIFDWDDIFVPDGVFGLSNLELNKIGRKISPRINNLSEIVQKHIHYKKNIQLFYGVDKLNLNEVVNFGIIKDYLLGVEEFNNKTNSFMDKFKLTNLLVNAVNQGIFIKSAKTYLQRLYWVPGLNSGLPLTPKTDDPKHELTYQFHDITHLNIPDLVFDGITCELNKLVYIGYRLMSECITLVFADMIFVLSMISNGMKYSTMKSRKIFQIMEEILKINPSILENDFENFIHKMLRGSYEFCFYQDFSIWKSFLGDNLSCLNEYSNKYDKFFMEDFKWTNRNWKYMSDPLRKDYYAKWWKSVKPWINCGYNLKLQSVSEFIELSELNKKYPQDNIINKKKLFDDIFDSMYKQIIKPLITMDIINFIDEPLHLTNAFIRYMIGQSAIFFKYKEFNYSDEYFKAIDYEIRQFKKTHVNQEKIQTIKYFYQNYLKLLHDANLVNSDFVVNSSDIYFIMKIKSVNYDIDTTNELGNFVKNLLNI